MNENGIQGQFVFDKRLKKKLRNQKTLMEMIYDRDPTEIKIESWLDKHIAKGINYSFNDILDTLIITTNFTKSKIRKTLKEIN